MSELKEVIQAPLRELDLPDIRDAIYETSNRLEALTMFLATLDAYPSHDARMVRNKLNGDYLRYINSKALQKKTEVLIRHIDSAIEKSHPNIGKKTIAREKALLSYYHKILIALKKNKPLSDILDARACRVVIDKKGWSKERLIQELCLVVDTTIDYLISIGYQPLPASEAKDIEDFNPAEHPEVYVPKKTYISEENKIYVKDYVTTPKNNGYQSFHVLVKSPKGDVLEIQFRTKDMDFYAEHKIADHDVYKEKQIKDYDLPVLDRTKVHWDMYEYQAVEKIDDTTKKKYIEYILDDDSGLEKSLVI